MRKKIIYTLTKENFKMEGKYYLAEIERMKNFDFAERIRFFIEKFGCSQAEFYRKLCKEYSLAERTFKSYIAYKDSKSMLRPTPETIKNMAKILNVPSGFLTWDADEFKKFLDRYKADAMRKTKVLPITIDIENGDIEFQLNPELLLSNDEYIDYLEQSFKEQNNPDDKENEDLYCFIQLLLEVFEKDNFSGLRINDKIYKLLDIFNLLNESGKAKLIKYGNIIVDDVLSYSDNDLILPRNSFELEEIVFREKRISSYMLWRKIKRISNKHWSQFTNFLEELNELNAKIENWDIFLIGMNLDKMNNDFFPEDALESYVLIADLFSLDEDFQNN